MNRKAQKIFSIISLIIALAALFYVGCVGFALVLILCEYGFQALVEDVAKSTNQLWLILLLLVLAIMTVVRAIKDLKAFRGGNENNNISTLSS